MLYTEIMTILRPTQNIQMSCVFRKVDFSLVLNMTVDKATSRLSTVNYNLSSNRHSHILCWETWHFFLVIYLWPTRNITFKPASTLHISSSPFLLQGPAHIKLIYYCEFSNRDAWFPVLWKSNTWVKLLWSHKFTVSEKLSGFKNPVNPKCNFLIFVNQQRH